MKNKKTVNLENYMPVKTKHLVGPGEVVSHSRAKRSKAFKLGGEAYQQGKTLEAFPSEYRPTVGDSVLFDNFRYGWLAASTAKLPQMARY